MARTGYILGEQSAIRLRELLANHRGTGAGGNGLLGPNQFGHVRVTGPAVDGFYPGIPTAYITEDDDWEDAEDACLVLCPDGVLVEDSRYEAIRAADLIDGDDAFPVWVAVGTSGASLGYASDVAEGIVSLSDQTLGDGKKTFQDDVISFTAFVLDTAALAGAAAIFADIDTSGVAGLEDPGYGYGITATVEDIATDSFTFQAICCPAQALFVINQFAGAGDPCYAVVRSGVVIPGIDATVAGLEFVGGLYTGGAFAPDPVSVPGSAGDTGTPGQIACESGWLYVCVDVDTWERVALATW